MAPTSSSSLPRAGSAPPLRAGSDNDHPHHPPRIRNKKNPSPLLLPPTSPRASSSSTTKRQSLTTSSSKRRNNNDHINIKCSLALSRVESVLVSASGDVLVCRCRRSSMPYLPPHQQYSQKDNHHPSIEKIMNSDAWRNFMLPCCDGEMTLLNSGGGDGSGAPSYWSSGFSGASGTRTTRQRGGGDQPYGRISENDSSQRQPQEAAAAADTMSEFSVYEWEGRSSSTFTSKQQLQHIIESPSRTRRRTSQTTQDSSSSPPPSQSPFRNSNPEKENDDKVSQEEDQRIDAANNAKRSSPDESSSSIQHSQPGGEADDSLEGILPMPSFDYSHIHAGQNDMLQEDVVVVAGVDTTAAATTRSSSKKTSKPLSSQSLAERHHEEKKDDKHDGTTTFALSSGSKGNHHNGSSSPSSSAYPSAIQEQQFPEQFRHGIPMFLSSLPQIRISKVSAHPMGAHVLLISAEAILFTYGLNHHGQLGIGIKSSIDSKDTPHHHHHTRGFITTPTIVTPLLEHGGKAIHCAAGVDHSLVVVATEGRRLSKKKKGVVTTTHSHGSASSDIGPQHNHHNNHAPSTPNSQSSLPASPSGGNNNNNNNNNKEEDDGASMSSSSFSSSANHHHPNHEEDEAVQHHQVYAFGNNAFRKLGLVNVHVKKNDDDDDHDHEHGNHHQDEEEEEQDVLLPRRVALHCTVWPQQQQSSSSSSSSSKSSSSSRNNMEQDLPPAGIFDIAASAEHSSALVRRATGDIEVYMWGNATLGALGLISRSESKSSSSPSREDDGSRESSNKIPSSSIFPLPTLLNQLSYKSSPPGKGINDDPYPVQISLGPYSSFIVMSSGKAYSCGFSAEGMLGQGFSISHTMKPNPVALPADEKVISISAGAYHTMALTESGKAYSWGNASNDRLGLGNNQCDDADVVVSHPEPPLSSNDSDMIVVEWIPQPIELANDTTAGNKARTGTNDPSSDEDNEIIQICAGYDCSMMVAKNGSVLSFGKRSGRLGLGEVATDAATPQPLFGGLKLFHKIQLKRPPTNSTPRKKPLLRASSDVLGGAV